MKILDITLPLHPKLPVWPGSDPFSIRQTERMDDGSPANVTRIETGNHTGTHIDAPLHFIPNGKTTLDIPLQKVIGPCQVLDCRGLKKITADDLERLPISGDVRKILFKTDNSELWNNLSHSFYEDFCALTADAAQWIVERRFDLVGIDYLSIQLYHDPFDTHVILLSAEVVILEGLDLRQVTPGLYKLFCLPLKMADAEGTLARAVLIQDA